MCICNLPERLQTPLKAAVGYFFGLLGRAFCREKPNRRTTRLIEEAWTFCRRSSPALC